ncbi:MAG TPA: hypothetical protein VH396_02510 [Chitinophagaceae bacterium]
MKQVTVEAAPKGSLSNCTRMYSNRKMNQNYFVYHHQDKEEARLVKASTCNNQGIFLLRGIDYKDSVNFLNRTTAQNKKLELPFNKIFNYR